MLATCVVLLAVLVLLAVPLSCSKRGDQPSGNHDAPQKESREHGEPGPEKKVSGEDENSVADEGVRKAKLVLVTKDGNDSVEVAALETDGWPAGVEFEYEWTMNGKPSGKAKSISGFKRGDRLAVAITPVDRDRKGRKRVIEMEIGNTTPKITELKKIGVTDESITYQAVALDRDGDPVVFSLAEPVKGMTLDGRTGLLEWKPGRDGKEETKVTIKVSDGKGGESFYSFNVVTEKADR